VVAEESHQVAPDFTTVQGTVTLRLEPIEQGLRTLPSGQDVPERGVIWVGEKPSADSGTADLRPSAGDHRLGRHRRTPGAVQGGVLSPPPCAASAG